MRTDEAKKLFVKTVDSLCGRHSRWKIWQDMIWMFAATISNAVDAEYREKRENQFHDIAKQYSEAEMTTFSELFAQLVMIFEHGHELGSYRDFLGELFMELGLGNDAGGQFFTPYSVCKCMAEITMPDYIKEQIEQHGYASVYDCACGAGATLIAAADIMIHEHKINYQQNALFIAQDIDYTTALMCYIQLSLLGCAGYVHVGNTLTDPMTGHVLFGDRKDTTWYTPLYFAPVWDMRRQVEMLRRMFDQTEPAKADAPIEPVKPAEPQPTIIQVSGKQAKRKPKGHLMFEI